ncbi:MAG: MOSC domain-containing protein [Gemmatimonadales bacterium]
MKIAALNIYPIKGCRGVGLKTSVVDRLGLVDDRRLMLVDNDSRFISQREMPRLATLRPALDHGVLTVRAPGIEPIQLQVDADGSTRAVAVWGNHGILASDQGDEAARWFSGAIGESCRLVYFGPQARNRVDPEYSPRPDAETAFTDGYPIMAVVQESLDDLNTRLSDPVPMERFRPSIVVSGAAAWSEDNWTTIEFGSLRCDVVKPCARCVVTATDQVSGARHPRQEPLRTLAGFRTIPGTGAIFGQNIVPQSTGTVRVGDEVRSG